MERNSKHSLIKRIQVELPRGSPFGVTTLNSLGISAKLAALYVKSGWLTRLGQGTYAFAGDEITSHGAVKFLQRRVGGLHVGGKSALSLQGVRHNLATRETIVLWGDARFHLPTWFTTRFPARYVGTRLFNWPDPSLPEATIITPPGVTEGLRVAAIERAILELLHDVGTHQALEEARNIFEGVRNLRKEVVGKLLGCCTSVKTVRLFLTWARETTLLDIDELQRRHAIPVGSDKRWTSRMKDGTLLILKPNG